MYVSRHISCCTFGLVSSVEIAGFGFYMLADAFSFGDK